MIIARMEKKIKKSTMSFLIFIIVLLVDKLSGSTDSIFTPDSIEPSKTIVWGPGLKPDIITLQARYIFLQLVDKNNIKLI